MARSNGSVRYQRRTVNEWQELVAEFEQGGQTRKAFCSLRGLSLSTFDLWRRKLREDSPRHDEPCAAMFVEVESTRAPSWDVELELGGGVVLRVRSSQRC